MNLLLPLVPGVSTNINLFKRANNELTPHTTPENSTPIPGTPVANRPGHTVFDITTIPDGEYYAITDNPLGTWCIKKLNNKLSIADSFDGMVGTQQLSILPQGFANIGNNVGVSKRLIFYNDGIDTTSITLVNGVFDGESMKLVIERSDKTDLVVVTDLVSTTNTVVVTLPSVPMDDTPNKRWSLRNQATGAVILEGPAEMRYAAVEGV